MNIFYYFTKMFLLIVFALISVFSLSLVWKQADIIRGLRKNIQLLRADNVKLIETNKNLRDINGGLLSANERLLAIHDEMTKHMNPEPVQEESTTSLKAESDSSTEDDL